mgnify:CR=1 FL=1
MPKYHVEIEHTVFVIVEVEADSKEEAISLAHEVTSEVDYGDSVGFEVDEEGGALLVEAYHGGSCDGGTVQDVDEPALVAHKDAFGQDLPSSLATPDPDSIMGIMDNIKNLADQIKGGE